MNRGNGTKNLITPQQLGDVFEYIVFDLVNVKYQIKYPDGVLCKQRSDQGNVLGEISSNNRGVF